jgi:hypothetical protein
MASDPERKGAPNGLGCVWLGSFRSGAASMPRPASLTMLTRRLYPSGISAGAYMRIGSASFDFFFFFESSFELFLRER